MVKVAVPRVSCVPGRATDQSSPRMEMFSPADPGRIGCPARARSATMSELHKQTACQGRPWWARLACRSPWTPRQPISTLSTAVLGTPPSERKSPATTPRAAPVVDVVAAPSTAPRSASTVHTSRRATRRACESRSSMRDAARSPSTFTRWCGASVASSPPASGANKVASADAVRCCVAGDGVLPWTWCAHKSPRWCKVRWASTPSYVH